MRRLMRSDEMDCGSEERVCMKCCWRRQLWDANTTASQCNSESTSSVVCKPSQNNYNRYCNY